jgi:hypothetical protein
MAKCLGVWSLYPAATCSQGILKLGELKNGRKWQKMGVFLLEFSRARPVRLGELRVPLKKWLICGSLGVCTGAGSRAGRWTATYPQVIHKNG